MCVDNSTLRWIFIYTLSPFSFICFYNKFIELSQKGLSITLIDIWKYHSLKYLFLGFLCCIVIYFVIAFYLDNVLSQGDNFNKKWYYFITDLLKSKKSQKTSDLADDYNVNKNNNPYIENDSLLRSKIIKVRNIRKSFKTLKKNNDILKGIEFNVCNNEIFAILGHNGAGKTTLISIMLGILSPSSGDVYYNDGIKDIDVDSILKEIGLSEKKKNYPKELSGGQRRKLCIALAFLGSPKYVFLDEPTTGLDPYSRKTIWEFLSKKKEGRVIFITTHYMDEADSLADRKMIISNGEIECLGSSLFLKNKFNMSYSIDIYLKKLKDV
ncbi:hypothetical protein PIROE2DRAFT_39470, partial [Piromyces sp. E2]